MAHDLFDHRQIEKKWLERWEEERLFWGISGKRDETREKLYLLFAFAYPSGAGLHVGHVESGTALDILARFNRMKGKQVFFPVGWDAFGLPAENYAIKTGVHPEETTKQAIATFKRQVKALGISYDWESEVATSHPEYYRWTQWLFLQLFEKGLAYKKPGMVNWCPSCQTVLANEQVVEGKCERCETPVVQKTMDQWYVKITEYADELVDDLEGVDWPVATKLQQKHWVGRKEGVIIQFNIHNSTFKSEVECFTTRIDTVFGVTFLVVSPETVLAWQEQGFRPSNEVSAYVEQSMHKTEEERRVGEKEKTGVDTGLIAINPVNGEEVSVWVADYVLAEYGTGAVMGVPAHDGRDFEFAQKFGLPVRQVVALPGDMARSYLMGGGEISNEELEGLGIRISETTPKGDRKIEIPQERLGDYQTLLRHKLKAGFWNEWVGSEEIGFLFKLEDGSFQQFTLSADSEKEINRLAQLMNGEGWTTHTSVWGWLMEEPFYREKVGHSEYGVLINSGEFSGTRSEEAMKELPKAFPKVMDYKTMYKLRDWLISRQRYWGAPIPIVYDPEGRAHAVKEEHLPWLLPTDVAFKPTGESPLKESKEFKERVERLYGQGWVPEYDTMDTFVDSSWYFLRYVSARDTNWFLDPSRAKEWLPVDFYMIGPEHVVLHLLYSRFLTKFLRDQGYLDFNEPFLKMRHQGMILGPDHKKMSKSKGNVINPDEIIERFGADTLRMYEMFMGPIEADKPWDPRAVQGIYRFLKRVWKLVIESGDQKAAKNKKLSSLLAETVLRVERDIPALKFNTAIAGMMELVNEWESSIKSVRQNQEVGGGSGLTDDEVRILVRILAPFAPFMAEEMWDKLQADNNLTSDSVQNRSVHEQEWPAVDEGVLEAKPVVVVVQVNGRLRGSLTITSDMLQVTSLKEEIIKKASEENSVAKHLLGKEVVKTIWVEPRSGKQGLINFVVK